MELITQIVHPSNINFFYRKLSYLKVDVDFEWGPGEFSLQDPRQKFLKLEIQCNRVIGTVEIKRINQELEILFPPDTQMKMNSFLQSDDIIQSETTQIKDLVKEILKESKSNVISGIVGWIKNNITYTVTPGIPSATKTLKNRKGDCGDFVALFGALSRALNIPTKFIYGLMYGTRDRSGKTYWAPHVWTKVYVSKNVWIPVDLVTEEIATLCAARLQVFEEADFKKLIEKGYPKINRMKITKFQYKSR